MFHDLFSEPLSMLLWWGKTKTERSISRSITTATNVLRWDDGAKRSGLFLLGIDYTIFSRATDLHEGQEVNHLGCIITTRIQIPVLLA